MTTIGTLLATITFTSAVMLHAYAADMRKRGISPFKKETNR